MRLQAKKSGKGRDISFSTPKINGIHDLIEFIKNVTKKNLVLEGIKTYVSPAYLNKRRHLIKTRGFRQNNVYRSEERLDFTSQGSNKKAVCLTNFSFIDGTYLKNFHSSSSFNDIPSVPNKK